MLKFLKQFLISLCCIIFIACNNYESLEEIEIKTDEPIVEIEAQIGAQVTDIQGIGLNNVGISVNGFQFQTDENGLFLSPPGFFNQDGQVVNVLINGEIRYSTSVIPQLDDLSYKQIIIPNHTDFTLDANNTPNIESESFSCEIPFSSFENITNQEQVRIQLKEFDLENSTDQSMVPSALVDQYEKGRAYFIPMDALFVKAISEDDKVLELSSGQSFTLDFNKTTISASTELLYFNQQSGYWEVQQLSSENYDKGQIKLEKFGYYAFGTIHDYSTVDAQLKIDTIGIANFTARITDPHSNRQLGSIQSSQSGRLTFNIPKDKEVLLEILSPCQEIIKSMAIHSTEAKIELDNIHLDASFFYMWNGALKNCYDETIDHGAILWESDNKSSFIFTQSKLTPLFTSNCTQNPISFKGINLLESQSGPWYLWEEFLEYENDLYTIFACTNASEAYIKLDVDGESKIYWDPYFYVEDGRTIIEFITGNQDQTKIKILFTGEERGVYNDTATNILFIDRDFGNKGYEINCPTSTLGCGFDEFNISHYVNDENTNLKGRFKAEFWMLSYYPLKAEYIDVKAEFQVIKSL